MMEVFKILIVMVFIQTYTYAKINQPKAVDHVSEIALFWMCLLDACLYLQIVNTDLNKKKHSVKKKNKIKKIKILNSCILFHEIYILIKWILWKEKKCYFPLFFQFVSQNGNLETGELEALLDHEDKIYFLWDIEEIYETSPASEMIWIYDR